MVYAASRHHPEPSPQTHKKIEKPEATALGCTVQQPQSLEPMIPDIKGSLRIPLNLYTMVRTFQKKQKKNKKNILWISPPA